VLVEGETEETFVNEVLTPHLYSCRFTAVSARLMGNARLRSRRGGIRGWSEVQRDIVRYLRQDPAVIVTMMVDYYGLPVAKARAWPGRAHASKLAFPNKATHVESKLAAAIQTEMGASWNASQFVPFVVMHEFEGLLFSDCAKFAAGIGRPAVETQFQAIRSSFTSPEEINDSPTTHPSQRVIQVMPDYQKPLHGNLAALEIGFDAIRAECPHFSEWIDRLESLA
jgi:hypothetical protein